MQGLKGLQSGDVLIGSPIEPVALSVEVAFWQSGFVTRSMYAFFSGLTISLLSVTALGAVGLLDRM